MLKKLLENPNHYYFQILQGDWECFHVTIQRRP